MTHTPDNPAHGKGTGKQRPDIYRVQHYEDGSFKIVGSQNPKLSEFLRHAERFGPHLVLETAEQYLAGTELAQLALALQGQHIPGKGRFATHKSKQLSKDQRMRLVSFLVDEGLPNSRIATQLGVTERQVERMRKELREAA